MIFPSLRWSCFFYLISLCVASQLASAGSITHVGSGLHTGPATLTVASATEIYASTDYTLNVSTDGGTSWRATSGLDSQGIESIVADAAGNVYVSTIFGGFYKRSGVGQFTQVPIKLSDGQSLAPYRLGMLTIGGDGALYASDMVSVLVSHDGGATWTDLGSDNLYNASIWSMTVQPSGVIYLLTYSSGLHPDGMYYRTPADQYWKPLSFPPQQIDDTVPTALATDAGGNLYGAMADGRVLQYTNGYWTTLRYGPNETVTASGLAIDKQGTFCLSTDRGVYRSVKGATTWTQIGGDLHNEPSPMLFAGDGSAYMLTAGAAYKLSGTSWVPMTNFSPVYATAYGVDQAGAVWMATGGSGIFRSRDNGATWSTINTGLSSYDVTGMVIDAGGYSYVSTLSGVYWSGDEGAHWNAANTGLDGDALQVYRLVMDRHHRLYITTADGIYHSNDGGNHWVRGDILGSVQSLVARLAVDERGSVYVGSSPSKLYRSDDGGVTWVLATNGFQSVYQNGSYVAAHYLYGIAASGGVVYASTEKGVFSSGDGTNWSVMSTTGLDSSLRSIAVDSNGVLYGVGSDVYAYDTRSGGTGSWQKLGMNSSLISNADMLHSLGLAQDGQVYAGSYDSGVLKYTPAKHAGMSATATALGTSKNLQLTANLAVDSGDAGKRGDVYVAAVTPLGELFTLSDAGWTRYTGGPVPSYGNLLLGSHSIPLLGGADVSALAGTQILVGYGVTQDDLLRNHKYGVAYTIQ